jgi:glycosyltransferase involved in cell wall biosynthesis
MLEAASFDIPTVCFDGTGSREFVESDAGIVVPYLNVESMAERVVELLENNDLRVRLGQRARKKLNERHDIAVAAPKILGAVERLLVRDIQRLNHSH